MADEIILPWRIAKKPRQRLTASVRARKPDEPVLLPCMGRCSADGPHWTQHSWLYGSIYCCLTCGSRRRWGRDESEKDFTN